mmetsp:Transcript_25129/g.77547  ORF Transcript_25129/g.77547 Transcript_25129/m.77547 type:complete len:472 (+) Transcript_25129:64-1479(+)
MASCSLFAADGVMVVYGEVNDRLGPLSCLASGSALAFAGFQALSFGANAAARTKDVLFFAGLLALGLGGPGIFMGSLGFGAAEPRLEPLVTAACAAAWDSSSVVFLIFAQGGVTFSTLVFLWSLAGLGVAAATLLLLRRALFHSRRQKRQRDPLALRRDDEAPPQRQERRQPSVFSSDGDTDDDRSSAFLLTDDDDFEERHEDAFTPLKRDESADEKPAAWPLLTRRDTVGLVGFMALYNLKSAFYIESVADQIRTSLDVSAQAARRLDLVFNLAFPIGGFVTSLASATLLEKYHDRDDVVFLVVAVAANAFSLVQLLPLQAAQYAAALLFGPARTFQWAAYFHLFCNPEGRYPENAGGRLIGYGNLAIAVVGDGLPYALTAFVNSRDLFGTTALRYALVHVVLALAISVASVDFYRLLRREYLTELCANDDNLETSYRPLAAGPAPELCLDEPPGGDDRSPGGRAIIEEL